MTKREDACRAAVWATTGEVMTRHMAFERGLSAGHGRTIGDDAFHAVKLGLERPHVTGAHGPIREALEIMGGAGYVARWP